MIALRLRPGRIGIGVLAFCCALSMTLSGPPADGAPLSWNNPAGGSAAVAANWNPVQMPAASDDLTFALNATYTVTFNASVTASQTHVYRNGTVTLNMSSPHSTSSTVTIGSLSGDNPTVTLTTGTLTANANAVIGNSSGSAGALIVNDDDADFVVGNGADLIVGFNGDASLSIVGTGRVEVADQFIAGSNATSTPAVTISGFSIAPVNRSTLDVLGTGESRIGQGGDAVMTIDSGGRAHFAGDVIIANGSASASIVNVQTTGLLDATLDVDGDLLIGRNSSAIAAGAGTLNVLIGGQVDVAGETLLGDPNGGVGTLHMDGGEFYGILDISVLAGSTINGTGTINADVANSGNIQPTGASGLTFNGILSNTTNNIAGTKIHFGATGGYTGSGTCQADITGNTTATITPTGPLTIGANTTSGYSYGGQLQVGAQSVTLRDSNGAVLGGLTTIDGGNVLCTAGIGIQNGARVLGVGTLSANVTNSGILEPDSGSAVPGILTVDGNLLVNPSSNMRFELNGPGNSHRINVSGSLTLNGTVTLTLAPGYLPTIGEQIILVNATAGRTGTFSTVVHTALCDQYTLVLVYSSTAAIALVRPGLAVTSVGDVDRDGDQDLNDFIRWSACLAGPGVLTPPPGCDPDDFAHRADLDGPACADYDVDLADYAVLQRILGN